MKVTSVEIFLTRLGGRHPIFARVNTDSGLSGMGEAGYAYGVGATAAAGMIRDLAERYLIGRDPTAVEAFWNEIYDFAFWSKGGGVVFWAGVSALEEALWDIRGQELGQPVWALLGGKVRERVRAYSNGWSLNAVTPDEFASRAGQAVRDGYTALKIYPISYPDPHSRLNQFDIPGLHTMDRALEDLAVARVQAVREAVGPGIDLMIDLSAILTPDAVLHFSRRVAEFDIYWLEEPAEPYDVSGLERIAAHTDIPLATGERLCTRHGFRHTIESQAAAFLQPDVGSCGGIFEARKIAAMAEAFGLRIAPHNVASPFATVVALHLDACLPNFAVQEIFGYLPSEHYEIVDRAFERELQGGTLPIPGGAGWGVTVREDWLKAFEWAVVK